MTKFNINDMIKGWFVGNISPTAFNTKNCEVAYKTYKKNEKHGKHYHKVSTEITFIINGKCMLNSTTYETGDIIIIHPNEITNFFVIEDTETIVVKVPGENNDKYEVE